MRAVINYKAKMTWTDPNLKFHYQEMCNVTEEIESSQDGSWKTVNLDWEPVENT